MAEPISALASPIFKLVVQKLALLIQDEIFTPAGFEKDVKTLQDKFMDIQKVIEDAEEIPRRSKVADLLEELKDAIYDAENILDMLSTEVLIWNEMRQVNTCPPVAPDWIFRLKNRSIVHGIHEIMERFDSIRSRFDSKKALLNLVGEDSVGKEKEKRGPARISSVMDLEVVGRVKEKREIIKMLKSSGNSVDGRVSVTTITGMGGIGKTVLARQVYHDRELDEFDIKSWISVSDSEGPINMSTIFDKIIDACAKAKKADKDSKLAGHCDVKIWISVTDREGPMNVSRSFENIIPAKDYIPGGSLESKLQHSVEGLKLLLVLDDVWTENLEDWKELEKGLLTAHNGTRVIVTGRSENVFGLSPQNVPIPHIPLGKLPHEECLKLFARNAIKGDESDLVNKDVKAIADGIVSKCDGLPLAVEVIGCLLRPQARHKWSGILNNDLAKVEEEYRDEKHRTLFVLRLSYFHLPPELKRCFSFCSIFPKGHEFDKDELVKLWMAHSLVQPSKLAETLEEKGRRCFDRLQELSFFQQQPESEKYRMHDYLHDLAELVSGKYSCIVKGENPSRIDPKTHHIALMCEKVEGASKSIMKCKKLRTILMPMSRNSLTDFGKTLGKMFQTLKYLRVLDLSSSSVAKLPKTLAELKLLHYLNLSRTKIKWLPNELCSLLNLQTLKLLDCPWLLGLPKGLSRLINLRHLEIEEAFWKYRCLRQPPNIGRLTSLQNLHKFCVGEAKKGFGIEQLKGMNDLEGSLHIMELNKAERAAEANLKNKPRVQVLELEWASETKREISQLKGKTPDEHDAEVLEDLEPHSSLTKLRVHRYCGKRTPSWLSRGKLQLLKTLILEGCQNLETLMLGRQENLEVICIKNMQKLRELPAQLECPLLHTLKIINCPDLIQLPQSIPKLRILKVKKCNSLKAIPSLSAIYSGTLVLVDNPVLEGFPGNYSVDFRDLGARIWRCMITNCPKIHGLPAKYYNSCRASMNRKLEIGECESIYFDPSEPLTQLAIDRCRSHTLLEAMNIISEYKFGITSDSVVSLHYLQSLSISNISDLISFPTKWEVQITSLYISACKDLEDLFDSEQSCKGSLPRLVNLCIRDCPKLSNFPEEGLPPKLELLVIQSCIRLESLGPPDTLKDLTSLADVCIVDCPKLQSFPAQGFPSSLQHLRIRDSPLLTEKVSKNEKGRGPDWPKIMNIPYLEIDEVRPSPAPVFASCSQSLTCFKGH
ncbi:putative disease resistance protein RGA4 isoform X2 [Coffea arabica]|uniref:Disease resistance protein RGA4 isoform X2 n=1 Tax=Coffea arabica TaxID=13443 RepID=A0A6P6VW38_COFAR